MTPRAYFAARGGEFPRPDMLPVLSPWLTWTTLPLAGEVKFFDLLPEVSEPLLSVNFPGAEYTQQLLGFAYGSQRLLGGVRLVRTAPEVRGDCLGLLTIDSAHLGWGQRPVRPQTRTLPFARQGQTHWVVPGFGDGVYAAYDLLAAGGAWAGLELEFLHPDQPWCGSRQPKPLPFYHLERILKEAESGFEWSNPTVRKVQYGVLKEEAARAFREENYARVVELLSLAEPWLAPVEAKKLALARRKL